MRFDCSEAGRLGGIRRVHRILVLAIAVCWLVGDASAQTTSLDAGFKAFLEADIWPAAKAEGVSRGVFEAAFKGVKPNLKLADLQLPGETARVEEKTSQAEFQDPAAYFDEKKLTSLAVKGRALLSENRAVLARIAAQTGVQPEITVAVWGRESGFGAAKPGYNAFEVLGTKAYLSRRKDLFRKELLAALEIVADGHLTISDMRSSSAGALGQPQFMPSKFLETAVDFDGDGRRDIWTSVPDTLASIARYLAQAGWVKGRGWGFEATVPDTVSCTLEGPDRGRPLDKLLKAGVAPVSRALPQADEASAPAFLMMPAGRRGPVFVTTPNFYVIKTYNNSDLYALFVAQLADRMRDPSSGRFQRPFESTEAMTRGDVARLQSKLVALGYDVGNPDGLAGFKTRRSIGAYEEKLGRPATCWPSKAIDSALK